jgi:predicted nucleotidyltransferase
MDSELQSKINSAALALKSLGAIEVYVFGSAARGKMSAHSDIDIAISGLPPEKFFMAMAVAEDALEKPLDLVDLDEHTAFTSYLKDEGELLRVG